MQTLTLNAGERLLERDPGKDMLEVFADFLRLDVANGDASEDTLRGYRSQVAAWVAWCREGGIDPARATTADVKRYRQDLAQIGRAPATIAHKLTVLRRFYQAAVDAGLRPDNPAAGVKPPRNKRAPEDVPYLGEVELAILFRSIPKSGEEKDLRDRAMIGLMGLYGPRTVSITRANVEDLQERTEGLTFRVRGKNSDQLLWIREDAAEALRFYLAARKPAEADEHGTPLFTAVGNRAGGKRISRRGVRQVVDGHLQAEGMKRPRLSCHALRHTAGTLAYKYTQDLRAVQDLMGHASPTTTARYAHLANGAADSPVNAVPVTL